LGIIATFGVGFVGFPLGSYDFLKARGKGGGGERGANNASVFTACCRQLEGN